MNSTKLKLILPLSCLLLTTPCYAEYEALRAGVVAATRRVYKIELNAIKSAFILKSNRAVSHKPVEFKFPRQNNRAVNQKAVGRVATLNNLPMVKKTQNAITVKERNRSEKELNSIGWQSF